MDLKVVHCTFSGKEQKQWVMCVLFSLAWLLSGFALNLPPLHQMFLQPFKVLLTFASQELAGKKQIRTQYSMAYRDTSTKVAPAAMIRCSVTLELMKTQFSWSCIPSGQQDKVGLDKVVGLHN